MAVDQGDQTWIQAAIGGLGTLFTFVSGHLYVLNSSTHKRIDGLADKVDEKYVRKDTLAAALNAMTDTFAGTVKVVTDSQKQARTDHQAMAERLDDMARDLNILMGKFDQRFPAHGDARG